VFETLVLKTRNEMTHTPEIDSANNPLRTIELSSKLSLQSVDYEECETTAPSTPFSSPGLTPGQEGPKSWVSEKLATLNIFQKKNDYELVEAQEKDIEINDPEEPIHLKSMEIISDSTDSIDEKQNNAQTRSWRDFIMAWLCMVISMFALASIPPAFKYLVHSGIRPCLAASWRCQCMAFFIAVLAIIEVYSDKKNKVDWFSKKPDLPFPVIVHVFFSGIAWGGNLLLWIVGMQYTTAFVASLIYSSYPIMLVISLKLKGSPVSGMEMIGVGVSVVGMVISCLQDVLGSNQNQQIEGAATIDTRHQIMGYVLCLMAASCEVLILFNRIKTQKYVPLMQYTFSTTIIVAVMATVTSLLFEREGFIYTPLVTDGSTHVEVFCLAENCIFGWFTKKWFLTILVFGIWIGVFYVAGSNYAVRKVFC
jgi:drug/metabolite transporter (DMT)-like permease